MKLWTAGIWLALSSLPVIADDGSASRDAEAALERQRAQAVANQAAEDEAHRQLGQDMQAGGKQSMANDYRRALGREAVGKSDDDVIRLYREKEIAAGRQR